jgi:methylphosphotriester-DNA--protein-cysteine methyltransferase
MSRTPAARLREQEIAALELSSAGHSVETIADRLGVSPRTARRRVQDALRRIPAWIADDLRRASEERLNAQIRRINTLLDAGQEVDTEIKLRNLLLSCERERIQLYGLRLPAAIVVQHEMSGAEQ